MYIENTNTKKKKNIIKLPEIRVEETSFTEEVDFARNTIDQRLLGFKIAPDEGERHKSILKILLNHCDFTTDLEARKNLADKIKGSVDKNLPVPISLTIAHGIKAPNKLKNFDPYSPPSAAWLYNIFKLKLISEKIRTIYDPGAEYYLFEEGYIFNDIFNYPKEIVDMNVDVTMKMISGMDLPARIIKLNERDFPEGEVKKIEPKISDAEIYATLCSIEEMNDPEIMEYLYNYRGRNYELIKENVGMLWDQAKAITAVKNQKLTYRKLTGLFARKIHSIDSNMNGRLVDGAITEKGGRLSFKLTGETLFNHGAAIVSRNETGKYNCIVVPEYRIVNGSTTINGKVINVRPIKINLKEIGYDKSYIWMYEKIE